MFTVLSAEEIEKNYNTHLKIVETYITDRKDKVLSMINTLEEPYVLAPASVKTWHHNAFAGGYIAHVNNVVKFAIKQMRLFQELGGKIDFTEEELVFSALFHDLGKIGDPQNPNVIPQTDKWRRDKLSEMYTYNPDINFMTVPDRSLFTLQKYGIPVNEKEYLAIMLHDGVFRKANEPYFYANSESGRLKTNIVTILHTADNLAAQMEYDVWKQNGGSSEPKAKKVESSTGKAVKSSEGLSNLLQNL